jgi:hypothetical protein
MLTSHTYICSNILYLQLQQSKISPSYSGGAVKRHLTVVKVMICRFWDKRRGTVENVETFDFQLDS